MNGHPAVAMVQRRLQRLAESLPAGVVQAQPVLYCLDDIALLALDARIALLLEQPDYLLLAEVVGHPHRQADVEALTGGEPLLQIRDDALRSVLAHGALALRTVQDGQSREGQLQIIVQLRHGAHGGPRGAHRVALINGNGRGYAQDAVDGGFVHAIQELPRISGESLDIASLTLGIDGVEGQGRLARSADASDDDQLSRRQRQVEVAQVVLAGTLDDDALGGLVIGAGCGHERSRLWWNSGGAGGRRARTCNNIQYERPGAIQDCHHCTVFLWQPSVN